VSSKTVAKGRKGRNLNQARELERAHWQRKIAKVTATLAAALRETLLMVQQAGIELPEMFEDCLLQSETRFANRGMSLTVHWQLNV
jgi:hypothetical protein